MTGIRPSVQHTWDQTQLWLDDLYSDSTSATEVTESPAAEAVSANEPPHPHPTTPDVEESVAAATESEVADDTLSDPTNPFPHLDMTTPEPSPADVAAATSKEDEPHQPAQTPAQTPAQAIDHAADEYGSWWLQEPPPDQFDYPDLDPVDLDEPLGPPSRAAGGPPVAHPRGATDIACRPTRQHQVLSISSRGSTPQRTPGCRSRQAHFPLRPRR